MSSNDINDVAYGLPASGVLFPPLSWSASINTNENAYEVAEVQIKERCEHFIVTEIDSNHCPVGGVQDQLTAVEGFKGYQHPASSLKVLAPKVPALTAPQPSALTSSGKSDEASPNLLAEVVTLLKENCLPLIFSHEATDAGLPAGLALESILPCRCTGAMLSSTADGHKKDLCGCAIADLRRRIRCYAMTEALKVVGTENIQSLLLNLIPADDLDLTYEESTTDSLVDSIPLGTLDDKVLRSFVRVALKYRYPTLDCHSLGSGSVLTLLPSETFAEHCTLFDFSASSPSSHSTLATLVRLTRATLLLTMPPYLVMGLPQCYRGADTSAADQSDDASHADDALLSAWLGPTVAMATKAVATNEERRLSFDQRCTAAKAIVGTLANPKSFPSVKLSFSAEATKEERGAFHDGFRKVYGGNIWRKTVADGVLLLVVERGAAAKVLVETPLGANKGTEKANKRPREDGDGSIIADGQPIEKALVTEGSVVPASTSVTSEVGPYFTHFVAFKCNLDFMDMKDRLSEAFNTSTDVSVHSRPSVLPPSFTIAGIKDKSAITAQRVSVKGDYINAAFKHTTGTEMGRDHNALRASVVAIVAEMLVKGAAAGHGSAADEATSIASLRNAMNEDTEGVLLLHYREYATLPNGSSAEASWLLITHRQRRSFPIALGDLKGNRFAIKASIVGRSCPALGEVPPQNATLAATIAKRVATMQKLSKAERSEDASFPNHFGTQRFGLVSDVSTNNNAPLAEPTCIMSLYSCRPASYLASLTRHIGIYLLQGDWSRAVDALLFYGVCQPYDSQKGQVLGQLQRYLLLTGSFATVNTTEKFQDPQTLLDAFKSAFPLQSRFATQIGSTEAHQLTSAPPPCAAFAPPRSATKLVQWGYYAAAFRDTALIISKLSTSIKHARLGSNDSDETSPLFPSPFVTTAAGIAFRNNSPQWVAICSKAVLGIPFALRQLWLHSAQSLVYNHLLGEAVRASRVLSTNPSALTLGVTLPLLGRLALPCGRSGELDSLALCQHLIEASLGGGDEVVAEGDELIDEAERDENGAMPEAKDGSPQVQTITRVAQDLAPSLLRVLRSEIGVEPDAFFFDQEALHAKTAGEQEREGVMAEIANQRATRAATSVCGVNLHPHCRSSIATATELQWSVSDATSGARPALSISFSLPSGSYATMFLMHLLGKIPKG